MMLRGTDISNYQSSIPAGDFCILKATEGLSYNDPPFVPRWHQLAADGTLRGAYHFAHPNNDPTAEADHFLSVVRAAGLRSGDVLVLDHETPGISPSHDAAWARTWCAHVQSVTGIRPWVYTFLSFAYEGRCAGLGGYPLWIADPSAPVGQPRVPAPWSSWVMHQYSETGGIDHDVFNGTRDDWLALGGHSPDPQPQQEDDMLGQLNTGNGAVTPISWPQGHAKAIAFFADTGLVKASPIGLRVAYHKGGADYVVQRIKVDSAKGKTVVSFGADAANVDAVSVQREDDALTPVSWDAS